MSFQAIVDPCIRLVQGLDDNDEALFLSALTPDAMIDLRGLNVITPAREHPLERLEGRDSCVNKLFNVVGPNMVTMHMISNVRIMRSWKENGEDLREITMYARATHHKKDEGHDRFKVGEEFGNRYRGEVVRVAGELDEALQEDRWRIKTFLVVNSWAAGKL